MAIASRSRFTDQSSAKRQFYPWYSFYPWHLETIQSWIASWTNTNCATGAPTITNPLGNWLSST
eukprot:397712-Lingulodinium_polyedra.AAC.1